MLAHLYLRSAAHTSRRRKKERTGKEDGRKIARLLVGSVRTRVKALSEELDLQYEEARRAGNPDLLYTRAWYALRQKWATERKHYPLKDLAAAGGWKSTAMVLRYTQEDQETIDEIILNPTKRLKGRPRDSRQTHNTGGNK